MTSERAEIERLQKLVNLRTEERDRNEKDWQIYAQICDEDEHKIAEAAAFLDGLADRIEEESWGTGYTDEGKQAAADCRAMAKKLRGER